MNKLKKISRNKKRKHNKFLIKKPQQNKEKNLTRNKENIKLKTKNIKEILKNYKKQKEVQKQDRTNYLVNFASKIDNKLHYKTEKYRIKLLKIKEKVKNTIGNRFGYYLYTIEGLNLTKLLNILKNHLDILDSSISDKLTIKIKATDNKILEKLLLEYRYNYTKKIYSRLYNALGFVLNKSVLTITVILVGIFYLISNMFILKINTNLYSYEVKKILQNEGIKVGTKLDKIDTFYLENVILENLDISFCDIKIVGNTLNINITEAKTPIKTEKPDINNVVVAKCDCIISRELIYSGTKTKNILEVVKKGDILVNNYIIQDELKIPVVASGDIYGLIQQGKSISVNKSQVEKVKTGNKKTTTTLSFNNKFKATNSPYKTYEKVESTCIISDIIPIYKKTVTYYEVKNQVVKYDKNKVIKKYLENITNELKANIPLGAKYNRTFYTIKENEDRYILDCYIEYEDKVSTLSSLNI